MKKFIFFAILLTISEIVVSQTAYDVLLTTEREQILCIIKEITDTQVKYIRCNDTSGILFTTDKNKLEYVILKDGTKMEFENAIIQPAQETTNASASIHISQNNEHQQHKSNNQTIKVEETFWTKNYFYQDEEISQREVREILKNYTPAYRKYKSANACMITGCVFAGIALLDAGLALGYTVVDLDPTLALCEACICLIPMTACLIASPIKERNAIDMYNTQVRKKNSLSLKVMSSKNGIGLALCF